MSKRSRFLWSFVTLLLGVSLAGCGGIDNSQMAGASHEEQGLTQGDQASADKETADDEASQPATNGIAYMPLKLGSLAIEANDSDGNLLVSEETAREMFTLELEGKTYELPCRVQELLDDGWAAGSFTGADKTLQNMNALIGIPMHYKDGTGAQITVDVMNLSNEECMWDGAYLTGVKTYASAGVSVRSIAGFGIDSKFDDVMSLVGTNAMHRETGHGEEAMTSIFVKAESKNEEVGSIEYDRALDEERVSHLSVCLNTYSAHPLLSV